VSVGQPVPNYPVIDLFYKFQALGCHMVIWSGCGIDYAKTWAEKLGLVAEIRAKEKDFFKVVDIAVDDQAVNLGLVNIKVGDE